MLNTTVGTVLVITTQTKIINASRLMAGQILFNTPGLFVKLSGINSVSEREKSTYLKSGRDFTLENFFH